MREGINEFFNKWKLGRGKMQKTIKMRRNEKKLEKEKRGTFNKKKIKN